ncbi:MAG: protein kinase [Myxococcota bacterium]
MMATMRPAVATIGRYRLIESIGRGGMAEVFRARGAGLGRAEREVAIKMVHAHLAGEQEMVELFHREAQVASTLTHPNLVTVLESGMHEGRCYLVMEYVDGVDLRGLLGQVWHSGRPMPIGASIAIAAALCAGLHHAHERRDEHGNPLEIVHRDVSPSNVLVSRDGAVKVSDFGVAKAMTSWSAVHSAHGTIRGKLAYMAPEQARAGPVDRRADIFGVGSVLFEMLTGRRPVQGQTDVEMLHDLIYGDVPSIERIRAECPTSLSAIVSRALARDVEQRWPDARTMQQALERCALEEGCFVTPSALAAFVVEALAGAPAVVDGDGTTRVRDVVATVEAAEPVVALPTETLGEALALDGATTAGPLEVRPRRRWPWRRWPWIAASGMLVGVAIVGTRSWWSPREGSAPARAAEHEPAALEPAALEPDNPAKPPNDVPVSIDPSPPPVEPARVTDDATPAAAKPETIVDGQTHAPRPKRPRRRPNKARKPNERRSTIEPSESLFPVNE